MTSRLGAWRVVAAGLLLAALAALDVWQVRRAGRCRVVVRWDAEQASAEVDGISCVTVPLPVDLQGSRCGVYVYHPSERTHRQRFENLVLRTGGEKQGVFSYHLLDPERERARLALGNGWDIERGRGLSHAGASCERAVLVLPHAGGRSGELGADLITPTDAGIMVRGRDENNGLVFVVRPACNDAFFFRLAEGEPGPVLALAPLRDVTLGRESLRLLGLLGRLGFRGALAVAGLWLLVNVRGRRARAARRRRRLPAWLRGAILFGIPVILTAWVGSVGLERVPHLADETAYWFQARLFAEGRLWAPVPLLPEFFEHDHILMRGGRWMAKYPPLFSVLLAGGMRAGVPWLVNPVLAGLLALGSFRLAAGWRGCRAGWLTWLLLVSSPFFLFMGGNLMSHMAAATFLLWAVIAGRAALRRGGGWHAVGGGAALGAAVLTRPYTAILYGGVALLFAVGWAVRAGRTRSLAVLVGWGLAGMMPLAVAGGLWLASFQAGDDGDASLNVYTLYSRSDALGFGEDKGKGWLKTWGTWGHTPAKAVRSVRFYLEHTAHYLLGWPWQLSLMWVPVPLLLRRHRGRYLFMLAVMLALIVGHMFYWATQHIGYGARYWFAAVPLAATLSGIGMESLVAARPGRRSVSGAVGVMVCYLVLAGLVAWNIRVYMPVHLKDARQYGNVSGNLHREVERRGLERALVFVETENLLFNDGFFMNDPLFREGPVFARDLGAYNKALVAAFPDYDVYTWDKTELRPWINMEPGDPDG